MVLEIKNHHAPQVGWCNISTVRGYRRHVRDETIQVKRQAMLRHFGGGAPTWSFRYVEEDIVLCPVVRLGVEAPPAR